MRYALVLVGLVLAGCGSTTSTAPTPTPTRTYDESTMALLAPFAHDRAEVEHFVDSVCTSVDSPQQLIDATHASAVLVRLAVVAGCPDRKDWTP